MNITQEGNDYLASVYPKYTELQKRLKAEIIKFKDFTSQDYKNALFSFTLKYPKISEKIKKE